MVSIVRRKLLIILVAVVAIAGVLIIAFVALVAVFQERIAFQPQGPPYPVVPDSLRREYQAADGQPLFAFLVEQTNLEHGLLIAFHGNADLAALQIDWAEEVASRTGLAVLLAEYRGYGGLPGKPDYTGSQLDADGAYNFARTSLGVPAERIAFFGHSLGTAIATELATRHRPFALVLQSPFTSARDMTRVLTGRRPTKVSWEIISRIHFNTVELVKNLDVRVSVAHGAQDRVIPIDMGHQVYDAAKKKGEWLTVRDASHNDVSSLGGEPYWRWFEKSLAHLPKTR